MLPRPERTQAHADRQWRGRGPRSCTGFSRSVGYIEPVRRTPLVLTMLMAALAVGTSACNGGSDVPAGAVAVVDGTQVPKSALDELINRQKAVYATANRDFPDEDSKSYNDIQRN